MLDRLLIRNPGLHIGAKGLDRLDAEDPSRGDVLRRRARWHRRNLEKRNH